MKKFRTHLFSIKLSIVFSILLYACGPSEEYIKVKQALETHPKIVQRGAKIGKIQFLSREQTDKDKDLRFEAELLDEKGNVIGKALGFRVEGFGTRIFRVQYNDEPTPPPHERRERPRRESTQQHPTTSN